MNKPIVIIFAAGRGSRLKPYTEEMPKCLLLIDELSLIEHQVLACNKAGLNDIVVIIGYKGELIKQTLGNKVRYATNPKFMDSQTLYSFYCTLKEGYGKPHIHIDGDNFFDHELIEKLLENKHENVLLVDNHAKLDDEATKASVKNSKIEIIGKKIKNPTVEITGLMKMGPKLANDLYVRARILKESGKMNAHVFDGMNPLLKKHELIAEPIGDLFWTEIDFPSDLVRARKKAAELKVQVLER